MNSVSVSQVEYLLQRLKEPSSGYNQSQGVAIGSLNADEAITTMDTVFADSDTEEDSFDEQSKQLSNLKVRRPQCPLRMIRYFRVDQTIID